MDEIVKSPQHITTMIQSDLLKRENILWAGQPESTLLNNKDFFFIPFTVVWTGIAMFSLLSALVKHNQLSLFTFCFVSPLVLMVLLGLYAVFGRFIYKSWKKRNTYYIVTNQRILVLSMVPSRSLQAVFINQLTTIKQSLNSRGIGSIMFGNSSIGDKMYGNTGMEVFDVLGQVQWVPAFYDIKDANTVYQLISNLQNESTG